MENKLITHFYVKKARKDKVGKAPIYFRITVNGERTEISTNKKIEPDDWDSKSGRALGRSESARMINAQLTNLKNKTEKYFLKLDSNEERLSVHQVVDEIRGKSKNQMTLQGLQQHFPFAENKHHNGFTFRLLLIPRLSNRLVFIPRNFGHIHIAALLNPLNAHFELNIQKQINKCESFHTPVLIS